ncbi:MAG: sugar phosphate isomerase/epimerase [Pirellulales bacterium]
MNDGRQRTGSGPCGVGRREFLALSSAAAAAWSAPSAWALPETDPYYSQIGLQLWTVRNQLAADIPQTLAAVAKAGYQQVELMDVAEADKMVPLAKDAGLAVTSAFINWEILGRDDAKKVPTMAETLEHATRHGLKYLVFGYIGKGHREKREQLQRIAQRCNVAAEQCRQAGIELCYHNHSFEFQTLDGNKTGYDVFIEEFDPQLMKFEVDVFWVACGGWDPVETLQRLKGRVAQVHLKDLLPGTARNFDEATVPAEAFKELGAGNLNLPAILRTSHDIGVAQCHVEQDQSPDPLKSVAESHEYLRRA